MATNLNSRERVLKLFKREAIDYIPIFSGMGNVTVHGLEKYGWKFPDIHTYARKMASMAASTFQLFGFECAVVPFDMGVEAEVLGSKVNYYTHATDILYPTISQHPAEKVEDLEIRVPSDLTRAGRIPLVTEAIRILKKEVGDQVAVGSWVLGPYTLAGQLVDLSNLAKAAFKKTEMVSKVLDQLAGVLIEIIKIYREAGADYITVREMGAGPDILSPRMFESLVRPPLKKIFDGIESPKILHICGDTNAIVDQMVLCGADAISVEKKNNVVETRKKLGPDVLIFGELDAYGVLSQGKPEDVHRAVKEAVDRGVNAIWPGCDIWPVLPKENMEALMAAARRYGKIS
ncbi:MAG TPA: MtaA/CmuA family methyltransferase [Syntrophales bacterium]|nr:MtaA/CmuA family methyltransferase [Syntrophales bacterium]